MATYALDLSDGSQISVNAPSGATNAELLKLAKQQRRETRKTAANERRNVRADDLYGEMENIPRQAVSQDDGMFTDLAKGFGAGFVGTGEMAALGAATLLDEQAEVAARDKIQGIADAIKPSGGDTDDLSYKIGQTFGSIAGFAAPIAGVAAGIAALPVAAPAAAVATGAGALLGVGTAAGEASERARAAGATEEQRNTAIRKAAPFGLLEVAPLGRFMKSVDVPVINKLMDKLGPEEVETIGQRIQNAAVTGGAEGAQEATAEIIQNLAERGYNPTRDILEGSGESAALGGGAGAAIQFLVDAFTNSRKTGPATDTPESAQLEMDLQGGSGAAPRPGLRTNFEGEQGEMFADEVDLGQAPQREGVAPEPDPRQTEFDFGPEPDSEPDLVDRMQQKLLTGPDDLGLRNEAATGVPTTRDQRTARTSEGIASLSAANKNKAAVIEQAKAELQNDGMITPKTRKDIETTLTPKEAADALKDTRYEPTLGLTDAGAQDNRAVGDVQRDLVPPKEIQNKENFDAAVERSREGGLGALANKIGVEEQAAQAKARDRQGLAAAERGDVEAFEQPDLFAMEREQDERKYGKPAPAPEAVSEMLGPIDSGRAANPEVDLVDRIAALEAQETGANVRKATEQARQKQENIDVDTELGLRDMQERVAPRDRSKAEKPRTDPAFDFVNEDLGRKSERSIIPATTARAASGPDLREGSINEQPQNDAEQLAFDFAVPEPLKGPQDANTQSADTGTSGTSDADAGQQREGDGQTGAAASTDGVKSSDGEGVGRAGRGAGKSRRRAGKSDDSLKTGAAPKAKKTYKGRDINTTYYHGTTKAFEGVPDPTRGTVEDSDYGPAAYLSKNKNIGFGEGKKGRLIEVNIDTSNFVDVQNPDAIPDTHRAKVIEYLRKRTGNAKSPVNVSAVTKDNTVEVSYTAPRASVLEKPEDKTFTLDFSSHSKFLKSLLSVLRGLRTSGNKTNTQDIRDALVAAGFDGVITDTGSTRGMSNIAVYNKDAMTLKGAMLKSNRSEEEDKDAKIKKPAEFNRDAVGGKTTGAAGQVIPGVARSKTTDKKISADTKERFAPKSQEKTSNQQFANQSATPAKKSRAETVNSKEADVAHKVRFEAQPKAIQDIGKADTESNAPNAPMTASDKNKILKLLNDKRKTGKLTNAARKYFDSFPTFTGAIDALTYDVGMQVSRSRRNEDYTETTAQEQFYLDDKSKSMPAMTEKSARLVTDWMTKDAGMSSTFVKHVNQLIQNESAARAAQRQYLKSDKVAEAAANLSPEALTIREADLAKDAKKPLLAEATIDIPLRPVVKTMLLKGDLGGALSALGLTSPSPLVQRLATKLGKNIGTTKLTTAANLKTPDGVPVAGYFDPKTNTITINKTSGINAHTLLHEMIHAVTSATIANKSHPLTKQLTKIFEGVKAQELATGEYAATNLDEFVAETLANPDFSTQMKITTVNGRNPFYQMARSIANYVRTLLGRPTVPEQSTFDAVDNLVQALMSPTLEGRNASKMYVMSQTVAGSKAIINNLATNTIKVDDKYIDAARDAIGDVPRTARKVFLKFMPVNVLGKLARSRIAEAPELNTIVNGMSNALREANDKLRPLVEDIRQLQKSKTPKAVKDYATLSYLVPNASYYRIDPREPNFKKAYSIKKDEAKRLSPVEAKKIHDELRAQYLSMDQNGQKLYRTITNMFESRLTDAQAAVDAAIAASIPDDAGRKSATKRLAELLEAERGAIKPFAPLTRAGNYRLEYNTIDPKSGLPEYFIEYFDGVSARERAKKNVAEYNAKLLAGGSLSTAQRAYINKPMQEGVRGANFNFDQAPQNSFVYKLLKELDAAGVPKETYNGVIELVLDSMPERSFMQSFRKRGDKRGFAGDVTPTGMAQEAFDLLDTVQSKGRDYNRQIIQMQYGSKIQKWKTGVNDKYKTENLDDTTADYKKTLFSIADFAQSPNVARWSQNATSLGYAWTMGFNLSSAATAIFDVPMSGAPRLMGKYGDKAAIKALGRAASVLKNSPKERLIETYGSEVDSAGNAIPEKRKINGGMAGFSVVNYNFDAIRNMSDAELKKEGMTKAQQKKLLDLEMLAEVGSENAQFSQSLNQEHMDVTRGKDRLEMLNAYTSWLFHHSERYSREVLMTATYELELDRLRNNPKPAERNMSDSEKQRAAALEAVNETETTLGATASAGRPVIAQSGIGNVFMLFKRFAISKYAMMIEMTNDAFKGATTDAEKQDRAIARGQLGRFMVSSAAFAGVAGMPLMGALGMLYDMYSDDDEDNFDAVLDKSLGTTLSRGLVNAALGADMASRIEMNSLLYRPPFIDKDQSQLWTLAEQLGGPIVGITLSMERGIGLFNEGEFVRGTEAVMPAAVRNVMKGGRYATEGALTRRGDAISEDIGLFQTIMQFGGAQPTVISDQHRMNRNNRGKDDHLKETRTKLLRKLNFAASQNDARGYLAAYKEIVKYNRDLPAAARGRKVVLKDTIDRSRKSYEDRTKKMLGGIEYTPFMLSSNREYGDGLFD
mgnify:CR=1 FL=1